jgi:hypothetical protein
MGKATVTSHLGDGLYRVLYQPETADSTAMIAELEALKVALDAQLYSANGLVEGRTAAETVYNNATNDFEAALSDWAACAMQVPPCQEHESYMSAVRANGTKRAEAAAALNVIRAAIAENRAQYYSVTQEIAYLQNSAKGASKGGLMDVWCIDYEPNNIIPAETEVGTIETFGANSDVYGGWLPRAYINIKSSSDPAYAASDKCIKPIKDWKTAAALWAYCQWLHVMANNPVHSVGTVLSKFDPGQNYLDVELFGNTPTHQGPQGYPFINGEYSLILLNLPVNYLSCGAELFSEGDHVVVKFDDVNRSNPVVIGFADHPQECGGCTSQYIWPWHGMATDGVIDLPGANTHTMPDAPAHGCAWLLDFGGVDLTPDPDAIEAGETWLAHAMISGGTFRGADIGENTFVFIDDNNKCWQIVLTYSITSSTNLRINVSITRFLISGTTPTTKTINITCENITLGTYNGIDNYAYDGADVFLHDVWTNGKKALVGVVLTVGDWHNMCSLIELNLSGTGGETGSELVITASEIKNHSNLTKTITQDSGDDWFETVKIWSRYGYYNAAGVACAATIKINWNYVTTTETVKLGLYENATEIDYLQYHIVISSGLITWSGSLSAFLTPDDQTPSSEGMGGLIQGFTSSGIYHNTGLIDIYRDDILTDIKIGYRRASGKAHGFFLKDTTCNFASVVTPVGLIDGPASASGSNLQFAWNRKTGETAFNDGSAELICYV